MQKNLNQLSKTISYALRHNPSQYGLILDEQGWASVDKLIENLKKQIKSFNDVTIDDFYEIINTSDKKRFEIKDGKIRAYYGHTISTKISKKPIEPPKVLYHGTTPKFADIIKREGLKSMQRQYVHLSFDKETAYIVGKRRCENPVILEVQAEDAYLEGIMFYREDNGIWLSDYIPSKFIK